MKQSVNKLWIQNGTSPTRLSTHGARQEDDSFISNKHIRISGEITASFSIPYEVIRCPWWSLSGITTSSFLLPTYLLIFLPYRGIESSFLQSFPPDATGQHFKSLRWFATPLLFGMLLAGLV
jgi:hypothetical protein